MSSPLPYCRTNQTSSDVGMIGMITASARHRWTRARNGTKPKFFNDFSRACMRVHARRAAFRVSRLIVASLVTIVGVPPKDPPDDDDDENEEDEDDDEDDEEPAFIREDEC
jgi:hypothetical protein